MPVATLVSDCAGTSQIGIGFEFWPPIAPAPGGGLTEVSSAMLFHEPQSGHLPSHLGAWLPHFWQVNTVFCFTMAPIFYISVLLSKSDGMHTNVVTIHTDELVFNTIIFLQGRTKCKKSISKKMKQQKFMAPPSTGSAEQDGKAMARVLSN
jgi:hypothetical protein